MFMEYNIGVFHTQRVMDFMRTIPPGEPFKVQWWTNPAKKKLSFDQCVELRACRKYRK